MMRISIFSLCLIAAMTPYGWAEDSRMDVETLVSKVVARNPEIAFYEAEVNAAKAGIMD